LPLTEQQLKAKLRDNKKHIDELAAQNDRLTKEIAELKREIEKVTQSGQETGG
jgi:chaperonin cofactor prefoldin